MNIIKNIEKATYFINKLKADLPNIKNLKQRNFTIDMLNSFIVLINTVDTLSKSNKNIAAIDSLLLARLYGQMYQSVCVGEKIDIGLVVRNIDKDLKHNKSVGIDKIVDLLKSHELTMLFNSDEITAENMLAITPSLQYAAMVDNLLNQFKEQIKWS